MTDQDPEYVVLGETRSYDFSTLAKAIRLIEVGAKDPRDIFVTSL